MRRFPDHRSLARDDGAPHGRPALHRGVGVPHVRVGRGGVAPTPISSPATVDAADARRATSAPTRRRTSTTSAPRSTEMRDRTFVGESGAKIPGTEVIGTIWDTALELSLGANRENFVRQAMGEVEHALAAHPQRDDDPRGFRGTRSRGVEVSRVKFGIFYEHQLPRPVDRRLRVPPDPGRARSDRVRRLARHRLRVGGRAPLPRGVLALERARGVPRGRVATHEEHPPRARHRADPAAVQPSRAHRRTHRDARPREWRPRRLRDRRVVVGGRARRFHGRSRAQARDVGRGICASRCGA